MLILTIRTDKPEAEVGLYKDQVKVDYYTWQAHRELSDTIHLKIKEILEKNKSDLKELKGILIYKGPGSFTGLRIGFSVANAFAYALNIPVISESGDDWIKRGIDKLVDGKNEKIALPEYGALPNVTEPRK